MPSRSTPGRENLPPLAAPAEATAYAWGGGPVGPDDPTAVAKSTRDPSTGEVRYWLKRATAGPDRGFLFNPQSPAHLPNFLAKTVAQLGRGAYEFRKVSKAAFDFYLKFIVLPHNPAHLRNAERNG